MHFLSVDLKYDFQFSCVPNQWGSKVNCLHRLMTGNFLGARYRLLLPSVPCSVYLMNKGGGGGGGGCESHLLWLQLHFEANVTCTVKPDNHMKVFRLYIDVSHCSSLMSFLLCAVSLALFKRCTKDSRVCVPTAAEDPPPCWEALADFLWRLAAWRRSRRLLFTLCSRSHALRFTAPSVMYSFYLRGNMCTVFCSDVL